MASLVRTASKLATVVVGFGFVVTLGIAVAPRAVGLQTLIVQSGSMTGTAPTGSVVLARSLAVSDVGIGDVILIQRTRDGEQLAPVLHRVIDLDIDESSNIVVRTKGDANEAPDPDPYMLQGSTYTPVVAVPRVGYVLAVLKTGAGWFGLVILPLMLATAMWVRSLWREDGSEAAQETLEPSSTWQPEGIAA